MHLDHWRTGRCSGGAQFVTLIAVGLIKLASLGSGSHLLAVRDQLFGIVYSHLFLFLGSFETVLGIMGIVFFSERCGSVVLATLGALFLGYRGLGLFSGANHFCPCLGTAIDWLPGLAVYQDRLLTGISLWFLVSGLWFMWRPYPNWAPSRDEF